MSLPEIYFDVLACTTCGQRLAAVNDTALACTGCPATYPVVDGIPVLLAESNDVVSATIQRFYDAGWERDDADELVAKAIHEDMTSVGQRYIQGNEQRFTSVFSSGGRFFFDAAAGAQPRTEFGEAFDYHVCVDFSLTGLRECRRILGDRAVVICGSLLQLPVRSSICGGVIASHCLYHIDKDTQAKAIAELGRVQSDEGKTLIFYANPQAMERRMARGAKRIVGKGGPNEDLPSQTEDFYYYAHPIDSMRSMIRSGYGAARVSVEPLRLFSTKVTGPAFRSARLAPVALEAIRILERALARKAERSRYVSYVVEKGDH